MKHNFSRELTCFNFAQDIIQLIEDEGAIAPGIGAISLGVGDLKKAYFARFACAVKDDEIAAIFEALGFLAADLKKDCATFGLAHMIYHIIED